MCFSPKRVIWTIPSSKRKRRAATRRQALPITGLQVSYVFLALMPQDDSLSLVLRPVDMLSGNKVTFFYDKFITPSQDGLAYAPRWTTKQKKQSRTKTCSRNSKGWQNFQTTAKQLLRNCTGVQRASGLFCIVPVITDSFGLWVACPELSRRVRLFL